MTSQDSKKKSRGSRGFRSAARYHHDTKKWINSGGLARSKTIQEKKKKLVNLPKYPNEFQRIKIDAKAVRERMDQHFPNCVPRNLPSAAATGTLLFPTPNRKDLPVIHPNYLAMRFDHVIDTRAMKRLMSAWDIMCTTPVKYPDVDPNRSSSPALHLGVWELAMSTPRITGDSTKQTPEVVLAMDAFLGTVIKFILPKIRRLLQEYGPQQYERQQRAHVRVNFHCGNTFARRPSLNFEGVWFTLAVKEGSSERIHIDFNDDDNSITWVVPLGDWEGGEFCAPQLNVKIPIRPGQILGVMTKVLAHCGAPVTSGRRVILTLFSDRFLLKHADEEHLNKHSYVYL